MSRPPGDSQSTPRRWTWWAAGLMATWVLWRAHVYLAPRIPVRVSPETTFIDAAPLPNGRIDYAAWVNVQASEGATAENNAAVLLLAIEPSESYLLDYRDQAIDALRLAPAEVDGPVLLSVHDFLRQIGADRERSEAFRVQSREAAQRPWSPDQFPDLAEWLDVNAAALDSAVEAAQRERMYLPAISDAEVPLAREQFGTLVMWYLSEGLSQRAMLRLNVGDVPAVWSDLRACHRLGRLASQSFGGWVHGIAIERRAAEGTRMLLQSGHLTEDQCRRCLSDLEQLPHGTDLAASIDRCDRILALDYVLWLSQLERQWVPLGTGTPVLGGGKTMNVNGALFEVNQTYDALVAAVRIDDPAVRRASVASEYVPFNGLGPAENMQSVGEIAHMALLTGREGIACHVATRLMREPRGNIEFLRAAEERRHAELVVLFTAFALLAFHSERGAWPEALSELVPEYVSRVPIDPCCAEPLRYRRTTTGCLLYSIGPDGVPNGGVPEPVPGLEPPDDVAITLPE